MNINQVSYIKTDDNNIITFYFSNYVMKTCK